MPVTPEMLDSFYHVSPRPLGFKTGEEYMNIVYEICNPILDLGYDDAMILMRGPSVVSFDPFASYMFGQRPLADYDVLIVSKKMFDNAMKLFADNLICSNKVFLDRFNIRIAAALGLGEYVKRLSSIKNWNVTVELIREYDFINNKMFYSILMA